MLLESMFIKCYFAVGGGTQQQSWARIDSSSRGGEGEGDCTSMPNQCSGSIKSKRVVFRYRKKETDYFQEISDTC